MKSINRVGQRFLYAFVILVVMALTPVTPSATTPALAAEAVGEEPGYNWVFSLSVENGNYQTKLQASAGYVDDSGNLREVYGEVQPLSCTRYGEIEVRADHIVFEDGEYLACQVNIASAVNRAAVKAGFTHSAPAVALYRHLPAVARIETQHTFANGTDRITFFSHPNLQARVSGNGNGYYLAAHYSLGGNTIAGTSAPFNVGQPDYFFAYSCTTQCAVNFSGNIGSSQSGSWTGPVEFSLATAEFLVGCVPSGSTGPCQIKIYKVRVDPTSKFG